MIFPLKTSSLVSEAGPDDTKVLSDIHSRSFARGWSPSELDALFKDRLVHCLALRRSGLLMTDQIVGFVLVRSVVDEAEILTIAVDPDFRRSGGGRNLMEAVMRKLYADRVAKLFLEVDATNEPALSLYQNLGFEKVGERKGYYRNESEDPSLAFIMKADL